MRIPPPLRTLRATPIVSTVAILSLALGIGANTAIFSLVNSLLLRALPVHEPQQLALVGDTSDPQPQAYPYAVWEQVRSRPQLFDGAFVWSGARFNLSKGGQTDFIDGIWASGRMFETLGVPALLGRTFTDADDVRGGGRDGAVAVISYSYWQRRYDGDPRAVGEKIDIERVPFTIVGVTPPSFFGPEVGSAFDVAIPIGDEPLIKGQESFLDRRTTWWLELMVRLKPGQTLEAAQAALRGVQPQIRAGAAPPDWQPQERERFFLNNAFALFPAATGESSLRQRYERPLVALLILVALVLVIACANIANLLMARAAARRHELSVRLALGASTWTLARQLLAESLLMAGCGAALGLLVARWASELLVRQLSTQARHVFLDVGLDWRVLAFTLGVTVATSLLFGTAPAFRASTIEPIEALKEQGRGAAGDRQSRLASGLVIAQVALSLVLVVAAGLFLQTFSRLVHVNLGFNRDPVLLVTINTQRTAIPPADRIATFLRIHDAVRRLPGVADAAVSDITPVSGMVWNSRVKVPGGIELPEQQTATNMNMMTPGWFATYGTRIVAGRDFNEHDLAGSTPVAIVNQAFVKKFLGALNPIGRTAVLTGGYGRPDHPLEIVGLAQDAAYRSVRAPAPPTMYVPITQFATTRPGSVPFPSTSLSVRAAYGSPALLTRSITDAIAQVNPDIALTFRPLADQVNASLTQERLIAILAGFFGALALLLAGLGLYGLTSYAVTRRRTEIGIRMALGAAPAGVVRLVLARVSTLVLLGVAAGIGLSLWTASFVQSLLFGLEPRDPSTLVGAALVLAAVGTVAGWLPAWRASRIDPADVLREG